MTDPRPKILTIEDEESIQEVIEAYLETKGYEVFKARTGGEGWRLFQQIEPDVVILDLNLPELDGMEIAAKIRKVSDAYVLMLTARGEEIDRLAGLRLGADDYMVKPFSPRELVARVDGMLRRQGITQKKPATARLNTVNTIKSTHVEMNLDSYDVFVSGQKVDLTTTEFGCLKALIEHHNQVLSRDQLLTLVWGDTYYRSDRIVDVYVGQVRRKLENASQKKLITTIRGVGYKFSDE